MVGGNTNNLHLNYPITLDNVLNYVLGQRADVGADGIATYWDVSVSAVSTSAINLYARKGNTPEYRVLITGHMKP